MKIHRTWSLSFFLAALPLAARAQESAAFLKIGVGARALGMGGAYTSAANDVNAIAWNPAGLSCLPKRELGASHAELVADTRYDFLGYAHPTQYGTFAAAAAYLSQGAIDGRDAQGRLTGNFQAVDSAMTLGYALRLTGGMRLGGSVKYIKSRIADASAQSYAVDVGGQYELGREGPGIPVIGLVVQNLGPGMKFLDQRSPLPLSVTAGLGYRLPVGVILALDYKQRSYSKASEVSVGTEYAMFSSVALRAGYSRALGAQSPPLGGDGSSKAVNNGSSGLAALSGFAAGFGLKAYGYNLDYSMTLFGQLGNAQRFSLGARF